MSGDILEFSPLLRRLAAGQFGHEGPSGIGPDEPSIDPLLFDSPLEAAADYIAAHSKVLGAIATCCDQAALTHEQLAIELRNLENKAQAVAVHLRRCV